MEKYGGNGTYSVINLGFDFCLTNFCREGRNPFNFAELKHQPFRKLGEKFEVGNAGLRIGFLMRIKRPRCGV